VRRWHGPAAELGSVMKPESGTLRRGQWLNVSMGSLSGYWRCRGFQQLNRHGCISPGIPRGNLEPDSCREPDQVSLDPAFLGLVGSGSGRTWPRSFPMGPGMANSRLQRIVGALVCRYVGGMAKNKAFYDHPDKFRCGCARPSHLERCKLVCYAFLIDRLVWEPKRATLRQ
jgi:hypothetical protein